MPVQFGIDLLCQQRAELVRGRRVGLIAHQASIGSDFTHAIDLLRQRARANVVRVFAPEHGSGGGHQDMAGVDETYDPLLGAPVVSLYGHDEASLTLKPATLDGVDVVVADLMDVGARYYTFYATIVRAMPACQAAGVPLIVCDRPNPITGNVVEGNFIQPEFHSFVGELSVPARHGLTIGELCRLALVHRGHDLELNVIPATGWTRERWWDQTGLPWVPPSPNMPTLETAIVYPGGCLIEATNLSEGRGTTRPFELIGAPWIDGVKLATQLAALRLPGVVFRPTRFVPTFQKHAGRECQGVFIHVTDRTAFRPVLSGLAVLGEARRQDPVSFQWRREPYEFVSEPPAIDLLAGEAGWRQAIEQGASAAEIAREWPTCERAFLDQRQDILIYPS
jgi:uncharacterized protein YbbC (DUF1343 family)